MSALLNEPRAEEGRVGRERCGGEQALGGVRSHAIGRRPVERDLASLQRFGAPVVGVILIRKFGVAVVLAAGSGKVWAAVLGREPPLVAFKTSEVQVLQPPPLGGLLLA